MQKARACFVALLIVTGLVLVGCGGSGTSKSDAQAVLKDTFGPGHPIKSGKLSMSLRVSGSGAGLDQPFSIDASGPFVVDDRARLPRFALQAKLGGTDQAAAGLISTGEKGYITVGDQAFELTAGSYTQLKQNYAKTQRENEAKQQESSGLSALGIKPAEWLSDATTVTDADVSGTSTKRVSGELNVEALLKDVDRLLRKSGSVSGALTDQKLPQSLDPATRDALVNSITTAKVSVDAGRDDGTLRRLSVRLILDVAADDRKALGGLRKLDIDLDIAIAELGRVQSVETPKGARPISELGRAASSLSVPQAPKGATTTQTTPPAADSQQQYTDCLAAAGQDVAKVQKCADLINP